MVKMQKTMFIAVLKVILMAMLMVPMISSSIYAFEKNINTISPCSGYAKVKIQGSGTLTQTEAFIRGCEFVNFANNALYFHCYCDNNKADIWIVSDNTTDNFYVTEEYYLFNMSEPNDKRQEYFSGVNLMPPPPPPPPPQNISWVWIIVLVAAVILVLLICAWLFWYLWTSNKSDDEEIDEIEKKLDEDIIDMMKGENGEEDEFGGEDEED